MVTFGARLADARGVAPRAREVRVRGGWGRSSTILRVGSSPRAFAPSCARLSDISVARLRM
eukprot:4767582-Lingulodinium_polyedra.AAC.1